MKKTALFASVVCALVLAAGPVPAQNEEAIKAAGARLKQNMESLRSYAWQSRVKVSVDGEQKNVTLYQVRYNASGELEKTPMGGEADQKKVRGPVRKNVAKKKKKKIKEFAQDAAATIDSYMKGDTIKKAMSQAYARQEDGLLKLRSENILKQGDAIELAVIEASKQPQTFGIQSDVDGDPISVEIAFQKLDDGTNYPALTVVNAKFDGKPIKIETENFSYVKQ